MMMKNKKTLTGIIFNSLLFLTLTEGNASNLSKDEVLNKSYHKPQSRSLRKQVLDLQERLKSLPPSQTLESSVPIYKLSLDEQGNLDSIHEKEASEMRYRY